MALEIPVASKLGTPRCFAPKLMQVGTKIVADYITGPTAKSYRRTMEPCTTTETTTIIGQWLASFYLFIYFINAL